MPPRRLLRGFLSLWLITGLVVLIASLETASAEIASANHRNPHLMLLGVFEALAALLFLVPRVMRVGAALLIAIIAIAFVVHATLGQFRGDLLVFGAVVVFVAIHGSLSREQLREALRVRPASR